MPAIQTVFPLRQDAGIPGMAAMSRYDSDSAVVQTVGGIAFGQPVMRGPDPRGCVLYDGSKPLLGIARHDRGTTSDRFPKGKPAGYMERGHMFQLAEAQVAADDQVRWNSVTGRYTNAAASATVLELAGWTFDTPTAAGGGLTIIKRV